jgi:hypothetical protein
MSITVRKWKQRPDRDFAIGNRYKNAENRDNRVIIVTMMTMAYSNCSYFVIILGYVVRSRWRLQ